MDVKAGCFFLIILVFIYPNFADGRISEKWRWTGGITLPDYCYVLITPLVINLTDDNSDTIIDLRDIPDIVFISKYPPGAASGILRAINGNDGSEIFTVTDPAYGCFTRCQLAAGDIDGDGLPEVVAVHEDELSPLAFEHDGTFKWKGDPAPYAVELNGALEIADLDHDGKPEIIIGSDVWDIEGKLLWSGLLGVGGYWNRVSCTADLDYDGNLEVIAGNTAYRWDGSYFWIHPLLPDGYTSIADFDLDGNPDIVLQDDRYHNLYLLNADGTVRWGPEPVPGPGHFLSGVAIADFNGDRYPEIVLTHHTNMYLFDRNGSVLWTQTFLDYSGYSSPVAFDFNEDGQFEIVYNDEENLYIINGSDGAVLDSIGVTSQTNMENPVIADIDNDGKADIVVSASRTNPGVRAYSDQAWPDARKVWNQFNYRITNVEDLGAIPEIEPFSWILYNTYRTQISFSPSAVVPCYGIPRAIIFFTICCLIVLHIFHVRRFNSSTKY